MTMTMMNKEQQQQQQQQQQSKKRFVIVPKILMGTLVICLSVVLVGFLFNHKMINDITTTMNMNTKSTTSTTQRSSSYYEYEYHGRIEKEGSSISSNNNAINVVTKVLFKFLGYSDSKIDWFLSHFIWQQITPKNNIINGRQKQTDVYGEEYDDFTIGKSCHLEKGMGGRNNQWVCRDCGGLIGSVETTSSENNNINNENQQHHNRKYQSLKSCPIVKPKGLCPNLKKLDWDDPRPRSRSVYDPDTTNGNAVRLLTTTSAGRVHKYEYLQPQCTMGQLPCFDITKCFNNNNNDDIINVYIYPGGIAQEEFETAIEKNYFNLSKYMKKVSDPNKACLFVAHDIVLSTIINYPSWNGGMNHFIYGVSGYHPDSFRDRVFDVIDDTMFRDVLLSQMMHPQMASIGISTWTNAHIRNGYDISFPYIQFHTNPKLDMLSSSDDDDLLLRRERSILLNFKGTFKKHYAPYYQHRWLAAEYIVNDDNPNNNNNNNNDVVIDVQCVGKTGMLRNFKELQYKTYDNTTSQHYIDIMTESTFVFCPGGSGVGSYRFREALVYGTIPVVLPEVVLPLAPEIDWSTCVVTVSQSRIIDLPRLLRKFSHEEIIERRKECRRLYRSIIENENHEYMLFAATMMIWVSRIHASIESTKYLMEGKLVV